MRAVVMLNEKLTVETIADPVPQAGEVLAKSLACGICGSDLHMLHHGKTYMEVAERVGMAIRFDLKRPVVFGHEFCAEVLDYGPGTGKRFKPGTRVCSVPVLFNAKGVKCIGYDNDVPGALAEYVRLNESMLLEVPEHLSPEHAAMTEPMAVGYHAVAEARLTGEEVPLVIGCGPVGLAVIAALRLKGIAPIVASDFSPMRRRLAELSGAHVLVDPAVHSPFQSWSEAAVYTDASKAPPQMPWVTGPALRPSVIFDCVGVPGLLKDIMSKAPEKARIVVVGVCMEPDRYEPAAGISKELSMKFVLAYTPEEFALTLAHIAEGRLPVEHIVTGLTDLDGVARAFEELASPEKHAKVIVKPSGL